MDKQVLNQQTFVRFLRSHKQEILDLYNTKYQDRGQWYGVLEASLVLLKKDNTLESDGVTIFILGDLLRESPHYTNPNRF